MNQPEYKQKKRECWGEFLQKHGISRADGVTADAFIMAFDRAYALGKQEIKQEIKQEKDAEGEVMLTVSRRQVLDEFHSAKIIASEKMSSKVLAGAADMYLKTLEHLFGSKCLPDNVDTSEPNVDSSHGSVESLEPKPAEPKFAKGDIVRYRYDRKLYIVECKTGKYHYALRQHDGDIMMHDALESDLEPYTEPEGDTSPNVNSSDIDIDELVAKGCVPDPAKQFDNILKDSFSKERRLTIAAQMMQGLICAPLIPGIDPNPPAEYLAQTAFRLADALIAEAEKGGDK